MLYIATELLKGTTMNRLSREKQVQVINCLVEGNSIRSTVRLTGVAKNTVIKLLVDLGTACQKYHDTHVRNLNSQNIQCDEIWSFVYAKAKNAPAEMKENGSAGDIWTWTALDSDSKLIVSWLVGGRDADYAIEFMDDGKSRLKSKVQLTTDGNRAYLQAVENSFGADIDYAMLIKHYGGTIEGARRYSPAVVTSIHTERIMGNPKSHKISTSHVERQNLTIRMQNRRFTRLTNAHSKKVDNHCYAIAIHFMYYNFVRVHGSLKTTPAVEAGITNHKWTLEELLGILDNNSN